MMAAPHLDIGAGVAGAVAMGVRADVAAPLLMAISVGFHAAQAAKKEAT
jgi:hypothetical protein